MIKRVGILTFQSDPLVDESLHPTIRRTAQHEKQTLKIGGRGTNSEITTPRLRQLLAHQ